MSEKQKKRIKLAQFLIARRIVPQDIDSQKEMLRMVGFTEEEIRMAISKEIGRILSSKNEQRNKEILSVMRDALANDELFEKIFALTEEAGLGW